MKRFIGVLVLALAFGVCGQPSWATDSSELNDAVLYLVNDPQELTYADINKLIDRNKIFQQEHKNLTEDQVTSFYQHIAEHGVRNPGTGQNQVRVAYVVQNQGPDIQGVVVLKGDFDREKVLDIVKKHYAEHSGEHAAAVTKQTQFDRVHGEKKAANPYAEADTTIDGHSAHIFPMPLRNRELIVVSTDGAILISSAERGNRKLLGKTIAVVDGRIPLKEPAPSTKVVMAFAPSNQEKNRMEDGIWKRYDQQKQDTLSQKKHLKKLGERFRQKVIKNKIQFFVDSLQELNQGTMTVERGRTGDLTKTATMEADFASPDQAGEVKKRLLKHMVKEIKRQDDVKDKFALGNISITTQGNKVLLRCQLRDSKEQLHAFHLISTYVDKGMLERL